MAQSGFSGCESNGSASSIYSNNVLTKSQAKSALRDAIAEMNLPQNLARINDAKQHSQYGHIDMLRHMQCVFPIVTEIFMDVVSRYGFERSGEGVIQFTVAVKEMEKEDGDIAFLNSQLRTYFLPSTDVSHHERSSQGSLN